MAHDLLAMVAGLTSGMGGLFLFEERILA